MYYGARRTCAAAIAAIHHGSSSAAVVLAGRPTVTSAAAALHLHAGFAPAATAAAVRRRRRSLSSSSTRLFSSSTTTSSSSTFQPADPPGTFGTPVFSDLDLSQAPSSAAAQQRNTSPNAVFVVTGANRGIGLQFVQSLLDRTRGTVVACCRDPEAAADLQRLVAQHPKDAGGSRIHTVRLDVEDQASIEQAGATIRAQFDRVDLLLNVAGILGDAGKTTPGPERSLDKMDRAWLEKTLAVNLVGPVMLTKELLPLLKQKRPRGQRKTAATTRRRVVITDPPPWWRT